MYLHIKHCTCVIVVDQCFVCLHAASTLIKMTRTGRPGIWGGCARVLQPKDHVIQLISSLVPSFLGVYLTQATGTTIGQVGMDVWSGTDSSQLPSPIRNQWGNRWDLMVCAARHTHSHMPIIHSLTRICPHTHTHTHTHSHTHTTHTHTHTHTGSCPSSRAA